MDSSRRAVESYWRSRLIDAATSDEDKVAPVYKLEEICDLLRSSHVSIVKELSGFILKRLDHKSPIVKQKALRLIKYAVGKSGVEFRREMQRHSVAVRPLIHYKGQLDPLKGDALNKAVRDTAQEVITAIFSEENKPQAPPVDRDDRSKRIQGFGNTNYEAPSDDKKSFISEVVGLGSASIKQGLSNFSQTNSFKKNDNGSYKSPNLHRSLTKENQYEGRSEPVDYGSETRNGSGFSKNMWNQDMGNSDTTNGNSSSSSSQNKTPEERLLETIVTSGGVRLQPTRDAVQVFLGEAVKLNVMALSHAIEVKLQAPHWQVRMKAVCVLESILRRKDDEPLSIVASYFGENREAVVKCSESPQSSLREKANKVLSLLGEEQTGSVASTSESIPKANLVAVNQMPDLIDTGYSDDFPEAGNLEERRSDQLLDATSSVPPPLIDDLFGDNFITNAATSDELKNDDDDPFADVSFHTNEAKEPSDDLFSGMTVDGKKGPEIFDIFGPNNGNPTEKDDKDVAGLMGGLSINNNDPNMDQKGNSSGALAQDLFSDPNNNIPTHQGPANSNFMLPPGVMPYNMPPGLMFNQAFGSQQMNYGAMGNLFAQQLATMSNFQHLGNLAAQNPGSGHSAGLTNSYTSALPDIFQPNFPSAVPNPALNNSKKEDTKAFDFISDHIAAARDPKRLV